MKGRALCGMLLFAFVISCISLPAVAQVMVIISRHGEKAATPANDPPLTEAGKKRAELLASMLVDSGRGYDLRHGIAANAADGGASGFSYPHQTHDYSG